MTNTVARRGSIPGAMAWMVGLSMALFWIPLVGGLIAGYVGGYKAGNMGRAAAAVFLPGVIMWVATFFLGTVLASIPILGPIFAFMAGLGAVALSTMHTIPLLIGALIGGAVAGKE